jgi:geranylgeranyl pyrophosphate synthase
MRSKKIESNERREGYMMVAAQVAQGLEYVDASLINMLDSDVDTLADASKHIIKSGGKRIRPQVAILSYLAAGGDNVEHVADAAAALEMVHTATLVHDDINDHSMLRRGKLSVHARWGRTFALLAGDYMFAKVYQMMAHYGIRCNQIMSDACVNLVEGETLQALAAKAGDMNRETYKTIIERKTASLFTAGTQMGAIIAGATEEVIVALGDYGRYLGMTFQVVDDILDIVGDPEKLGKPVGLDVSQNRGVMVAEGSVTDNGATTVTETVDPVAVLMNKLRESGAVEIARLQAQELAQRARTALQLVPPSPARDELYDLIDLVLERDR